MDSEHGRMAGFMNGRWWLRALEELGQHGWQRRRWPGLCTVAMKSLASGLHGGGRLAGSMDEEEPNSNEVLGWQASLKKTGTGMAVRSSVRMPRPWASRSAAAMGMGLGGAQESGKSRWLSGYSGGQPAMQGMMAASRRRRRPSGSHGTTVNDHVGGAHEEPGQQPC